jgi:hypothetical protein
MTEEYVDGYLIPYWLSNKQEKTMTEQRRRADEEQIGGNHYTEMPSHEEFIGFLKGNVIKYSLRAGRKEGSDDVAKAKHYLKKLQEVRGAY